MLINHTLFTIVQMEYTKLYELVCFVILLATQGSAVDITYLESAKAKGAGENYSLWVCTIDILLKRNSVRFSLTYDLWGYNLSLIKMFISFICLRSQMLQFVWMGVLPLTSLIRVLVKEPTTGWFTWRSVRQSWAILKLVIL